MANVKQKSEEIGWPDGRFRLFAIAFSAMVSIIFLLLVLAADLNAFSPITGLLFVVMVALLEPSKQPHIKDLVAKIILGQAAFLTSYAFVWRKRKVDIDIENSEGDASVHREHELKNRDERNIKNRSHHFAFSSSSTDPEIIETDGSYIDCYNNGNNIGKEIIASSENYLEFIVNFPSSVEPGEVCEYDLVLEQAKRAFPHEDESHSWQLRTYTSVETYEITVCYQCDVSIQEASIKNVQTNEDITSVDINNGTGRIHVHVQDLEPGHYELEWILN